MWYQNQDHTDVHLQEQAVALWRVSRFSSQPIRHSATVCDYFIPNQCINFNNFNFVCASSLWCTYLLFLHPFLQAPESAVAAVVPRFSRMEALAVCVFARLLSLTLLFCSLKTKTSLALKRK